MYLCNCSVTLSADKASGGLHLFVALVWKVYGFIGQNAGHTLNLMEALSFPVRGEDASDSHVILNDAA